jgi:hypothetical protein
MPHVCLRCHAPFTREQRAAGRCPHCDTAFETAELVALCIGLTCSYMLLLVLPELLGMLFNGGSWQAPSEQVVILRAAAAGAVVVGTVLLLAWKATLWQGASFTVRPWLRLLWIVAFPGLLYAGLVLAAGVGYLCLTRRWPPRRALGLFLA